MRLSFRHTVAAVITASLALGVPLASDASAAQRLPGDRCRVEGRTIISPSGTMRCTVTKRGLVWGRTGVPLVPAATTTVGTPTAPTLVVNTPSSCEPLRLSWSGANPDTGLYSVQWTPLDRADFNSYTKYDVRGTSVTLPNWFIGGTTYRFRVFAMRSEWNGLWHSTENVTPHSNLVDASIPACASSGGGDTGGGSGLANATGTLDSLFSTSIGTGPDSQINAQVIQSDGKIVVGGQFISWDGTTVNRIARLNGDGTRDTAFTTGAGAAADGFVRTVAVQSDGKILVGGQFINWSGVAVNRIVRLNSDGTRDATFTTNAGSAANGTVRTVTVQADGKILVGGEFTAWNGTSINRLVRLNRDGTLDSTFATGAGTAANSTVRTIVEQADGKIVIGGEFTAWNGTSVNRIIRLNADGTHDTAFTTGTGTAASGTVAVVLMQDDQKILVATNSATWNGQTARGVIRLNADGTRDTGFSPVHGPNGNIEALALQSNGQILFGGPNGLQSKVTHRQKLSGVATLQTDSNHEFKVGDSLAMQIFESSNFPAGTYTVTAVPAPNQVSFNLAGTDVAYGTTISVNATITLDNVGRLVRLNSDGTRDRDFTAAVTTGANSTVNAVNLQSNGSIVVGGAFTTWKGASARYIVRLN